MERLLLINKPNSQTGQLFAAAILLLTLAFGSGCSLIGNHRQGDILKPLGASSSSQAKSTNQPMPSERSLCMKTAAAVAAKGHSTEAIKLYERAEQLDPAAAPLDARLAPLYANHGNPNAAIERYQRCVERAPQDTDLSNNLAWTLMEAERFDQAIAEANRGLTTDPDNARLLSTLAVIHYRTDQPTEALQYFKRAYGETAARHNLAILDIDAGKCEDARKHLEIVMQSGQGTSKTKTLLAALEDENLSR